MRLQLKRAALLVIGCAAAMTEPRELGADGITWTPAARTAVYQDSDDTTIVTALSAFAVDLTDDVTLGGRYLVDVVSSASADVVSQATGRFQDVRHEVGGTATYDDDGRSMTGSYGFSVENDWTSHNLGLAASHDFLERNLTLSFSFAHQRNAITRANSIGFERSLRAYLSTASAAYTFGPRDLGQISVSVFYYDGFQSSPYRYVFVDDMPVLENFPRKRWRNALLARHHHYFEGNWALRSHARLYADSYGVEALTVGVETIRERDPLEFAMSLRGYGQTGASFYEESYSSIQEHMAVDKELSPFFDVFVGPSLAFERAVLGPFRSFRVDWRVSLFYFHYLDFAALDRRYGLVTDVGLSLSL